MISTQIVVNEGKWLEGTGVTEAVTVMSRAEYELYDFLAQVNVDLRAITRVCCGQT